MTPGLPIGVYDPRCDGQGCPSRTHCDRSTNKGRTGEYAALYLKREPGDSACHLFIANKPMSTFEGIHRD